jgi:hypothetical protein
MADLERCYTYLPIVGTREFRILYLHPGKSSDMLIGRLEHAALDANWSYEALSYEWGSPEREKEILIDNHGHRSCLRITQSLYHALHDLRGEDSSSASRLVWADGVCINQDDLEERAQQVSIMGSIYRYALRVITYIGPEADDSERAIDFVYHIWGSYLAGQDELSNFALSSADEGVYGRLPPKSDPRCEALKKLLLRGWTARCWCAQEFLLNNELRLMCGRREINEWYLFPSVVQLVFNRSLPSFLLPSAEEDPNSIRECIVKLLHTRTSVISQHSRFTLLDLLSNFHPLQASDPRDKVYSLLGLASDRDALNLPIDYTCTAASLYITVAAHIISIYQPIEILYCNLGTKNLALPSWVPDWSKWRFGTHGMLLDYTSCAGGHTRPAMRVVGGDALDIAGCLFDQITLLSGLVGPRFTGSISNERRNRKSDGQTAEREYEKEGECEQDREDMLPTHEWLVAQVELVAQLQPYPDGSLPLDVLWRTLTSNITRAKQTASADYVAYFCAHLALCREEAVGSHSNASYSSSSSLASTDTTKRDMAYEFRDNVRRRMRYRRLCVTSKKYFGAVPEEARIGDWVCVIEGARSWFVIRDVRREKGGFELVGPGYVHGLMRGEFMRMDGYEKGTIRLI